MTGFDPANFDLRYPKVQQFCRFSNRLRGSCAPHCAPPSIDLSLPLECNVTARRHREIHTNWTTLKNRQKNRG